MHIKQYGVIAAAGFCFLVSMLFASANLLLETPKFYGFLDIIFPSYL
jgi:hypothetical protein